ncbi:MAG: DUF2975 domain-containing protein [Sediminibacterium sp.]
MTPSNNFIFKVLHIIAWIIFAGLCIEAGALLVNFIFSITKPESVDKLYLKLDLSEMYQRSQWAFYGMYSFILFIAGLKAYLFYVLVMLMHKIDMAKPFDDFVAAEILKISYTTFSIGIISHIGRQTAKSLTHYGHSVTELNQFWEDGQAFILMAAVIYVIGHIFKRGVALQTENDLTV